MSNYLPLSQRPRRDESAVTNDWSKARGTVLVQLAGLIEELSDSDMDAPALLPQWSVRDLAADALLVARASKAERTKLAVRGAKRAAATRLANARALQLDRTALATELRAVGVDDAAASAPTISVSQLGEAVVALLDVAASTNRPVDVDPVVSGAVALNRALAGPAPARAVARERSLVATDANWRVGNGRTLEGSAAGIVLFLYGRGSRGL